MNVKRWFFAGVSANAEPFHLGSTIARLKLKGNGGSLLKRWGMWFNLRIRKNLTSSCILRGFWQQCVTYNTLAYNACIQRLLQYNVFEKKVVQVLHGCRQFVP